MDDICLVVDPPTCAFWYVSNILKCKYLWIVYTHYLYEIYLYLKIWYVPYGLEFGGRVRTNVLIFGWLSKLLTELFKNPSSASPNPDSEDKSGPSFYVFRKLLEWMCCFSWEPSFSLSTSRDEEGLMPDNRHFSK